MIILGVNYFYHDTSACLLVNGELKVALEEERFNRVKHTYFFPKESIDRCFEISGIDKSDVDYVAVSIKPRLNCMSKIFYGLRNFVNAKPFVQHELLSARYKQKSFWEWYNSIWRESKKKPKVVFVPHHLSHASGSFFVSPFESAAVLSLDGSGEWATSFLGWGKGNVVEPFGSSYFPDSLGSFYEAATEFCGFKPNYDEGKTMGLAPFGDPSRFFDKVDRLIKVDHMGRFKVDLDSFSYQYWGHQRCSDKFYQTFGLPRKPDEEFEDHHYDVAAAFQKVLEERVLELCQMLYQKTNERYLVMAGGVALNSVMNGRILRETPFEDIYVMPAAGDNGTCIGAAFYVYNSQLGYERDYHHDNPYLGTEYSNEQILQVINEAKLNYTFVEDIPEVAADCLSNGEIVAWFQGRMEIGPRALGGRSILADPTRPDMKDKLNAEVKHREAFRPFAPSASFEDAKRFFEISVEAPFMLKVCNVREDQRERLPAITHVDGTARLQTVRKEINPLYHQLIKKFEQRRGVPVVLNTSFNIMGEPIIESPLSAIRCFYSTGLDKLIIGNYLLSK